MKKKPPKIAEWLLKRLTYYNDKFFSTGDMHENYFQIQQQKGVIRARFWYWSQVLKSIIPYFSYAFITGAAMVNNYLKIALRSIKRSKVYSLINISGLAVGLACTMLIVMFVRYELNYDNFHEKGDRIYRICMDFIGSGDFRLHQLGTPRALGETIKNKYPDVENVSQISRLRYTTLTCGEKAFKNEPIYATDQNFFKVFTFPLSQGDPDDALSRPNTA
ncbi:MAG: ABC transporter permease, partial [bacterium]|nr:ABC transporter permease [bacterium]